MAVSEAISQITRYEAAALLASCLDRVTELTEEVEQLLRKFESELNYVAGSIMLLEDRVAPSKPVSSPPPPS